MMMLSCFATHQAGLALEPPNLESRDRLTAYQVTLLLLRHIVSKIGLSKCDWVGSLRLHVCTNPDLSAGYRVIWNLIGTSMLVSRHWTDCGA